MTSVPVVTLVLLETDPRAFLRAGSRAVGRLVERCFARNAEQIQASSPDSSRKP